MHLWASRIEYHANATLYDAVQAPQAAGQVAHGSQALTRRAIGARAAALSASSAMAAAVEAEAVPMPSTPVNEANMVADLETVLQERDACGVRGPRLRARALAHATRSVRHGA